MPNKGASLGPLHILLVEDSAEDAELLCEQMLDAGLEAGFERVDALRASPYSARAFFLLNADQPMREQAQQLSLRWGERVTWHPDLGA